MSVIIAISAKAWISEAADGRNSRGQLVFQWPAWSEADLLLAVGETVRQGLGPISLVDGHDIGAGEMSVFIHTDDPKGTFEKTMSLIQGKYDLKELMVGRETLKTTTILPSFDRDASVFRVA